MLVAARTSWAITASSAVDPSRNQPLRSDAPADSDAAAPSTEAETPVDIATDDSAVADTLAQLVAATPKPETIDPELRCLAQAVYFESRGESLAGQLAVAHVVINRAKSGRFPTTLCGVVHQPSQFSFVRRGKMPAVRNAVQWSNALAIAQIARDDSWQNRAPGALFFHARYVSPGWRKTRIAQIDNHIFYR